MAEEPTATEPASEPAFEDVSAEPKRVRRRRSGASKRRSSTVQAQVPFTNLRFTRPRLPDRGRLTVVAGAIVSIGLGLWALLTSVNAQARFDHAQASLTATLQRAAAGQQAADELVAQSRAEASRELAAQDAARVPLAPRPIDAFGSAGPPRSSDDADPIPGFQSSPPSSSLGPPESSTAAPGSSERSRSYGPPYTAPSADPR